MSNVNFTAGLILIGTGILSLIFYFTMGFDFFLMMAGVFFVTGTTIALKEDAEE